MAVKVNGMKPSLSAERRIQRESGKRCGRKADPERADTLERASFHCVGSL